MLTHVPNDAAWQHGRLLQIGETGFLVDRNPPTIDKVTVQLSYMCAWLLSASILKRHAGMNLRTRKQQSVAPDKMFFHSRIQLEVHGRAVVDCPLLAMPIVSLLTYTASAGFANCQLQLASDQVPLADHHSSLC